MDSQSEKTEIKSGISRRSLFKGAIAGLGLWAIKNSPLAKVEQLSQQIDENKRKEEKQKKEFKIEEVLLDPTELLDKVAERIEQKPPEARTQYQKQFLTTFGPSSNGEKKVNREDLINGYKKFGGEIVNIRKAMSDLNIFPGLDIDMNLPFFSNLTSPFADLIKSVNSSGDPYISLWHFSRLVNVGEWLGKASQGTYDDQKANSIIYNKQFVDLQLLNKNIEAEWDFIIKAQRYGKIEGFESRRKDAEELQIKINETIDKSLPLAFARFKYDALGPGRGHFREFYDSSSKGEFIEEHNFIRGFNAWLIERGIIKSSLSSPNTQDYFNSYLLEVIHELGHGVDPLFQDRQDIFYIHHPGDYFNYLKAYLDMFGHFKDLLDGNPKTGIAPINSEGVEAILLDPLAIRDGFGIDQIETEEDAKEIQQELDDIFQLCVHLEHPEDGKKYRQVIEEMGLSNLFIKSKYGMFFNWQALLGEKGDHAHYQQAFLDNISSFDRISRQHILELKDMVQNIFVNKSKDYGDFEKKLMADIVIRMKSVYILASFVLLRGLEQKGMLKKDDTVLYPIYQKLSGMVYWQFAHAATGTLGEYLRLAGLMPDIRIAGDKQLPSIFNEASELRKSSPYFSYSEKYDNPVPDFLEKLYKDIVEIQKRRAILWGADIANPKFKDNPNQAYTAIASDVIEDDLGLNDLYGHGVG